VELTMKYFKQCTLGLVAAATLSGCAAYKMEPPAGFAMVSESTYEVRLKAQDNVGVKLQRFENVKGGTLAYWASDLVNKLGKRGYVLTAQSAMETKNGREGTRFDFDYTIPGTDKPKFFTVSLFVTDKYRIVVQVAGDQQYAATYRGRNGEITGELKVRGCKVGSKICGSPQPGRLQTPTPDVIPDGPPSIAADPANPTPAPVAAPGPAPVPAP
jgi:hypothetical protein